MENENRRTVRTVSRFWRYGPTLWPS